MADRAFGASTKRHFAGATGMGNVAVPQTEQLAVRLVPVSYQRLRAARGNQRGVTGMGLATIMRGLATFNEKG
nr:hypothetical protein [uncultured Noviherbaspirillum sp.]